MKKQKQDYRKICEGKNEDLLAMTRFIEASYKDDKALQEFISKENGKPINPNDKCILF